MLQRLPHNWAMTPPPHPRPQLLVKATDPALTVSDFSRFSDAGFSVALCSAADGLPAECPLLCGARCRLVESADVVFLHLGRGDDALQNAVRRLDRPSRVLTMGPDGDISPAAPVDSQIRAVRHLLTGI